MVRVPLPIAQAGICYLGDNEKSASCTNDELHASSKVLVASPRGLTANQVSLFYAFNGLFVSSNIELSVLIMRIFNIVFLLGLFYLARKSAPEEKIDKFILVLLVTSVPGVLFLMNSNNSSSWTFLGTAFAWFFAHQYVVDESRNRRLYALAGLIAASILGIGSRSESAVFIAIQIVFISVLGVLLQKSSAVSRRAVIISSGSIAFGLLAYFGSTAQRVVGSGFLGGDDESPIIRIGRHVFFSNLLSVTELYTGLLGGLKGIGGSLTELTGTVRTMTTLALGFVIIASFRTVKREIAAYLFVLTTLMAGVPLYILQKNQLLVGEELVPRYLYPLLVLFVGSIILVSRPGTLVSRHQRIALALALGIANAISLRTIIHRHTHGIEQYGIFNLDSRKEWWWTISTLSSPLVAWVLGTVSFLMLSWTILNLSPTMHENSSRSARGEPTTF